MSAEQHDLDELLGAYALDAVSDDERRAVDEYLLVNPRARQEVAEHRDVAALLAWSGTAAPDGLWDRISAQLDEPAPELRMPLAPVTSIDRAPKRRWLRSAGSWTLATAAAAVVAVLVATAVISDRGDESPLAAAVAAAREDRDSRVASLRSADGIVVGEAIVDQDGHGYLVATSLPALPDDRTYQLWGVIGDRVISLGVLGAAPEIEPFSVDAPVSQVVITNEVAGGVVSDGNPEGAYAGELG